jgi:hypothetical protein
MDTNSQYYFQPGDTVESYKKRFPWLRTPKTKLLKEPKRNPGLLATAKEKANLDSKTRREIQQKADRYGASMRQARIDAINAQFAPRIAREQEEGKARLDRVAAINFNKGIVGSGVDTTKTGEQKGLNESAVQAIESEKSVYIRDAFDKSDSIAKERAKQLTEEKIADAEFSVNKYQAMADEALEALKMFGKGDASLEDIEQSDPETLRTLREVLGYSDLQLQAVIDSGAPEPKNVDTRVVNGHLVSSYFDPKTKKFQTYTEKLNIPDETNPSDIQVLTGKNGLFYAYNKKTNKVINTIGGGAPKSTFKPEISWEEYLSTAEELAQQTFTPSRRNQLKKQYEAEFPEPGDTSDYTPTEIRKLEQAGLLDAPRQEQLNYLYGDEEDDGGIGNNPYNE